MEDWAVEYGLEACGQYFQGFVEDYEALLTRHQVETVTSYGVRRSTLETSEELQVGLQLQACKSALTTCFVLSNS